MQPEEYIPPSLHTLCNHKPTIFNLGDDIFKFRALNGHQGPPKAPDPNLNKCKYNGLAVWETGEKIYEPLSVLETDAPVTFAT